MNNQTQLEESTKLNAAAFKQEEIINEGIRLEIQKLDEIDMSRVSQILADVGKSVSGVVNTATQVFSGMEGFFNTIAEFQSTWEVITQELGRVAEAFEEIHQDIRTVSQEISEKGWFIPIDLNLSLFEIPKLKDLTSEELDKYFLLHYTENNYEYMKELFEEIQSKIDNGLISSRYQKVLQESMDSYFDERYIVAIVALCPIVEGLLFDVFYNVEKSTIKNKQMLQAMKTKVNECDSLFMYSYFSAYKFVVKMFDYADFSELEPTTALNRHWILHGKSAYQFKQIDVIKLFALINTVSIFQDETFFTEKKDETNF